MENSQLKYDLSPMDRIEKKHLLDVMVYDVFPLAFNDNTNLSHCVHLIA